MMTTSFENVLLPLAQSEPGVVEIVPELDPTGMQVGIVDCKTWPAATLAIVLLPCAHILPKLSLVRTKIHDLR